MVGKATVRFLYRSFYPVPGKAAKNLRKALQSSAQSA